MKRKITPIIIRIMNGPKPAIKVAANLFSSGASLMGVPKIHMQTFGAAKFPREATKQIIAIGTHKSAVLPLVLLSIFSFQIVKSFFITPLTPLSKRGTNLNPSS